MAGHCYKAETPATSYHELTVESYDTQYMLQPDNDGSSHLLLFVTSESDLPIQPDSSDQSASIEHLNIILPGEVQQPTAKQNRSETNSLDVVPYQQHDVFSTIQATLSADLILSATATDQLQQVYSIIEACCLQMIDDQESGLLIAVGQKASSFVELESKLVKFIGSGACVPLLAPSAASTDCSTLPGGHGHLDEDKCSMDAHPAKFETVVLEISGHTYCHSDGTVPETFNLSTASFSSSDQFCDPSQTSVDGTKTAKSKRDRPCNYPMCPKVADIHPHIPEDRNQHNPEDRDHTSDSSQDASLMPSLKNECADENIQVELVCEQSLMSAGLHNSGEDQSLNASSSTHRELSKSQIYELLTPYSFFCMECSFRAKRSGHLRRHLKVHQQGAEVLQCKRCSFRTLRQSNMSLHEQHAHYSGVLSCKFQGCSYRSSSKKQLDRHVVTRHSNVTAELLPFPCPIPGCSYRAATESRLDRHATMRHRDVAVPTSALVRQLVGQYQCEKCSYVTKHRSHFQRHMDSVHENVFPFLCDTCGMSFKRKDGLLQHSKLHSETDPESFAFICEICSRRFRNKAHLQEHQSSHTTERPFLCSFCGAAFKSKNVQQKHVRCVHHKPHSHVCPTCGLRFSTAFAMRRHSLNIHGSTVALPTLPCTNAANRETLHVKAAVETSQTGFIGLMLEFPH